MTRRASTNIWINTGEISGDLHAASLCRALSRQCPEARLMGMGGPALRALPAFEEFFRAEDLSVMGFSDVLAQLPRILSLLRRLEKKLALERPDALIVVDAPDFHFRLLQAARRLDIPAYYYISPKVWAWRQGRAAFIRRHTRRLISILPFEEDFYRPFGLHVDYVGSPLLDQIDLPALDQLSPQQGEIGLMPGSRLNEVRRLMPAFARAAELLLSLDESLRFTCAVAPGMAEALPRSFWPAHIPLRCVPPEERYAFMRRSELLLAASGTATLESALIGVPTIIAYISGPLSFRLAKLLVRTPYIGLPNLIAGREILPELLQNAAAGPCLAAFAAHWLRLPGAEKLRESAARNRELRPKFDAECADMASVRRNLAQLRALVGGPGAAERAAAVILADLEK